MDALSCMSCDIPELPMLQSSCSPENSEGSGELTRWQRLRTLAQTKSLLPASAPSKAMTAYGGPHTIHVTSSPLDHFATPAMPHQDLAIAPRKPGQLASVRARSLLQSQRESIVSDSLDADLQVEAVLRKAAGRAACLAGLPKAPPSQNKVLANLQLSSLHDDQQKVLDVSATLAAAHASQCQHCTCCCICNRNWKTVLCAAGCHQAQSSSLERQEERPAFRCFANQAANPVKDKRQPYICCHQNECAHAGR